MFDQRLGLYALRLNYFRWNKRVRGVRQGNKMRGVDSAKPRATYSQPLSFPPENFGIGLPSRVRTPPPPPPPTTQLSWT